VTRLVRRAVEKPWGATRLPAPFPGTGGRRIGELWFEAPEGRPAPLLVKYIFTTEKLSVQVHPDDAQARARGLANGKSECWYILEAGPGARLGLGFGEALDAAALRASALDGSIERRLDWQPVAAGDFVYVPAGTVHAIGGGLALIEVQQPSDVTYRLYDYGRPRELHLDDGVAVASRGPYPAHLRTRVAARETRTLVDGPHFTLVHVGPGGDSGLLQDRDRLVVPLAGRVCGAGPGDCLLLRPGEAVEASADARFLLASPCGEGDGA